MTAKETIEYLDWDSCFFGLRIARFHVSRLDREGVAVLEEWRKRHPVDCLYFLADPADSPTIRLAEEYGFTLVDIRVTLDKRLGRNRAAAAPASGKRVRPFRPEDLPQLERIAGESHGDTRFYQDPVFPRQRCDELYETWIRNSCKGDAQAVFVARSNQKVAGYVTCHQKAASGRIGLIAVSAEHRRIGLGTELLTKALRWFGAQRVTQVSVVTQGRNVAALQLYERAGFVTSSIGLWYHKWFAQEKQQETDG